MIEEWRPVVGFDGLYEVSSHGRVRSWQPRWIQVRMLIQRLDKNGYHTVHLCDSVKSYCRRVHRLVAEAFIGEAPADRPQVNHKDFDKSNNHFTNLEYVSNDENMAHAAKAGMFAGRNNAAAKLTEQQVRRIRQLYKFGTHDAGTRALARKFDMSQYAIHRIVSNRNWKHLPDTNSQGETNG